MIHLEREKQIPKSLSSVSANSQEPAWQHPDVIDALIESFGQRCAYCEQSLTLKSLQIDHFRPEQRFPELQNDWTNLFPVCSECKRAKGSLFPNAPGLELFKPDADEMEDAFIYNGLGFILPKKGDLRAAVTIDLLELNRRDLIEQRSSIIEDVFRRFAECLNEYRDWGGLKPGNGERARKNWRKKTKSFFGWLAGQTRSEIPFAGLFRFIKSHFKNLYSPGLKEAWQQELIEMTSEFNPGQKPNLDLTILPDLKLQSLRLVNIRCFKDVSLALNGQSALILGINGRGKSTLLQLPALLARGLDAPRQTANWRHVARFGAASAELEIVLEYNGRPITLKAQLDDEDRLQQDVGRPFSLVMGTRLVFLAYGATRNVVRSDVPPDKRYEAIASIFGENGYLKNIKDSAVAQLVLNRKDWFIGLINRIISLGNDVAIVDFDVDSAYFKTPTDPKGQTPLEAMSDGFRATYAWLFDFLVRVAETRHETEDINGIVMVDEVDLHLHPTWQRALIPTLRDVFPKVQFIFTSHSPFVVQSMEDEPIFLLLNQESEVVVSPLILDGTPDGHEIESIIEKTIALENKIPMVGQRIFNLLANFKGAVKANEREHALQLHRQLLDDLPEDSGYRDFVEMLRDNLELAN